mmetsp:Transcript_4098/g.9790  ORF Transcript_4098/g.9790 Transcript_4098/m.9790 type:complete len:338 (-) Transcript_4098:287-1300(-)
MQQHLGAVGEGRAVERVLDQRPWDRGVGDEDHEQHPGACGAGRVAEADGAGAGGARDDHHRDQLEEHEADRREGPDEEAGLIVPDGPDKVPRHQARPEPVGEEKRPHVQGEVRLEEVDGDERVVKLRKHPELVHVVHLEVDDDDLEGAFREEPRAGPRAHPGGVCGPRGDHCREPCHDEDKNEGDRADKVPPSEGLALQARAELLAVASGARVAHVPHAVVGAGAVRVVARERLALHRRDRGGDGGVGVDPVACLAVHHCAARACRIYGALGARGECGGGGGRLGDRRGRVEEGLLEGVVAFRARPAVIIDRSVGSAHHDVPRLAHRDADPVGQRVH